MADKAACLSFFSSDAVDPQFWIQAVHRMAPQDDCCLQRTVAGGRRHYPAAPPGLDLLTALASD